MIHHVRDIDALVGEVTPIVPYLMAGVADGTLSLEQAARTARMTPATFLREARLVREVCRMLVENRRELDGIIWGEGGRPHPWNDPE